jgi:hypothetical protein
MQEEPFSVIKLDASSREAGALTYYCYFKPLITQQMGASGLPFG